MRPQFHSKWIAIAAMAENRVIGVDRGMPWHIPADFAYFKQTTIGHVLVMGRKTWDSIGNALPGRDTIVISRSGKPTDFPGAITMRSIDELHEYEAEGRTMFIAGGGEIYRQTLPHCAEVLLSRVKQTPPGDAWFPIFEDCFQPTERLLSHQQFDVIRWRRR